jgi:membrane associated rhomboid family serine protease
VARLLVLALNVSLLVLLVTGLIVYRVTTQAERAKAATYLHLMLHRWASAAETWYRSHAEFFDALRTRARFVPVTQTLAVVNTIMLFVVLAASFWEGRDTLVAWGASIGPRTTNGEWWRLVTSLFVHANALQLLACLVGLIPLGFVLERFVGSLALAAVYVTSGVFAGLMTVSAYPMDVTAGASGAICGLYGLAFATAIWGLLQRPRLTVPWGVLKWLACAGAIFFAANVPIGTVAVGAELTGFVVGLTCGVVLVRGVSKSVIPVRRTAAVVAAAFALAMAVALPLRGLTDIRPDIDRMRTTDERTAATFRAAATQLALGRTSEKAIIQLIEHEIIPPLQAEQSRLVPTRVVPADQEALMVAAGEYVRLRLESWRLRATAFRKGSLSMLRQAEVKEGAARDVLVRIPYPLSPT